MGNPGLIPEFRSNKVRKLIHVGKYFRTCNRGPVITCLNHLRIRRISEYAHTRCQSGIDTMLAVFDDDTAFGHEFHLTRGMKKKIRMWLAAPRGTSGIELA